MLSGATDGLVNIANIILMLKTILSGKKWYLIRIKIVRLPRKDTTSSSNSSRHSLGDSLCPDDDDEPLRRRRDNRQKIGSNRGACRKTRFDCGRERYRNNSKRRWATDHHWDSSTDCHSGGRWRGCSHCNLLNTDRFTCWSCSLGGDDNCCRCSRLGDC